MEIFKLIGSVFVDSAEADASLQKTDKHAEGVGQTLLKGIGTAAKWGAGIVTAAGVAVGAVVSMATNTANAASEIEDMSQKIGVSRTAYQELDYILGQSGIDVNILQGGMKSLVNQMDATANSAGGADTALQKLGVSAINNDGTLRSQEAVFYDTIAALQGMSNETERNALANDIFGKSATELAPLLNGGAQSMEELRQRAHELGLVMSDETVAAGDKLGDTLDDIKGAFAAMGNQIGAAAIPAVQQFADFIIANLPTIQSLISQLLPIIMSLLQGMLPPLMSLTESILPVVMTLIQTLLPPISQIAAAILPLLVQVIEQLLPPFLQLAQAVLPIVVQLITALLPILTPLIQLISPILEMVITMIQPLLEISSAILPYLASFIQSVLVPVLNVLIAVVQFVAHSFAKAWADIKTAWSAVPGFFTGIWNSVKSSAGEVVANLVNFFVNAWSSIKNVYNSVAGFFSGVFTDAWNGIKTAFNDVEEFFQGVFNTIKSIFKTPHFRFTGTLNPLKWEDEGTPKISVDWYRKGGVMLDPTLFGINGGNAMVGGEAGPEAIAPIETLQKYIVDAVGGGAQVKLLEAILSALQAMDENMYEAIVKALVSGVTFDVDKREFARLVRAYA